MSTVTVTVTLDDIGVKAKRYAKTDVRHWREKVRHAVTSRDSVRYASPKWMASFCHQGKRASLSLDTRDREEAARRARDLFVYLKKHGWEKTFQLCRPHEVEKRLAILYGQNGTPSATTESVWDQLRVANSKPVHPVIRYFNDLRKAKRALARLTNGNGEEKAREK